VLSNYVEKATYLKRLKANKKSCGPIYECSNLILISGNYGRMNTYSSRGWWMLLSMYMASNAILKLISNFLDSVSDYLSTFGK